MVNVVKHLYTFNHRDAMGYKMGFEKQTLTTDQVVKCDGDDAVSGHPVVYLNLGTKGHVVCPYCSKYFVREDPEEKSLDFS